MPKFKRPSLRRKPKIQFVNQQPQRRFWRRAFAFLNPLRWLRFLNPFRWLKKGVRQLRDSDMGSRLLTFLRRINPLRSLWFKLVGALVTVILIMLFAILNVINDVTAREFGQYIRARNEYLSTVIPTLVAPAVPAVPALPTVPPLPPAPPLPEGLPEEAVVDEETIVIEVSPELPAPLADPGVRVVSEDGQPVMVDAVVIDTLIEMLQVELSADRSLAFLDEVRGGAQRAMMMAGIAAIVLGTILFRGITRPLAHIRQASQSLAAGDLAARVPEKGRDELGKVGLAFNQMAAQLQQQDKLRQRMVADVAHELRTPVTVMQSNLEAMLDGILQPDEPELQELHDEVRRLSRMIEDLRLLSLADAGQLSLRKEPINVAELVDLVTARMTPLAQAEQVTVEADVAYLKMTVEGDGDRLQQALGNLIDNAIRHTPPGGRVRISAVREAKTVHISVADTGPGIPAADLPYLFERFWRGDRSRSRHSGGSGLGLAIVQQIATMHGGDVRVASPPGAGAIFTMSLPMANGR